MWLAAYIRGMEPFCKGSAPGEVKATDIGRKSSDSSSSAWSFGKSTFRLADSLEIFIRRVCVCVCVAR